MTAGVGAPLPLPSAIFISVRKVLHPREKVETEICTDEETLWQSNKVLDAGFLLLVLSCHACLERVHVGPSPHLVGRGGYLGLIPGTVLAGG